MRTFPKAASLFQAVANRLNPSAARKSLPYTQARGTLNRPPQFPPPSVYQEMTWMLSSLSPKARQQLMLSLWHGNFLNKQITRMTVNPISGFPGFVITADPETPEIGKVVDEFLTFNRLHTHQEQRGITTGYITCGEVCYLAAPYDSMQYVQRISPLLIRQTVQDPLNPYETIAVMLEPSMFSDTPYLYKTIVPDERRFSPIALQIRESITNSCYFWANYEDDELEAAPGWQTSPDLSALFKEVNVDGDAWTRRQRRGKPYLFAYSDVFNHIVETVWGMLDKLKTGIFFNYDFTVDTGEESNAAKSVAKVEEWKRFIGTPQPNSPFFHDQKVKMTPVQFTMTQGDVTAIMDTMTKLAGMSANITPYDLGNQNTTFATASAMGGPSEQFQADIQADIEEMLMHMTRCVLKDAPIPASELRYLEQEGKKGFGLTITSPEIAQKNLSANAQAFGVNMQSLKTMMELGLWSPDEIAAAGSKLSQEILGVEIAPLSEDEKAELVKQAQAQQQQTQPPQPQGKQGEVSPEKQPTAPPGENM